MMELQEFLAFKIFQNTIYSILHNIGNKLKIYEQNSIKYVLYVN